MTKRPSDGDLIKLLVDTDMTIRKATHYRAGPISNGFYRIYATIKHSIVFTLIALVEVLITGILQVITIGLMLWFAYWLLTTW